MQFVHLGKSVRVLRESMFWVLLVIFASCCVNPVKADVFIVDANSKVSIGDFECSQSQDRLEAILSCIPGTKNVTTGSLWQVLDQSGVKSLNQLTLHVDLTNGLKQTSRNLDVESIELIIRNADKELATYSLKNNSFVLPIEGSDASKNELQLVANLGYDFMAKFSDFSSEQIQLNVQLKDGTTFQPEFYIANEESTSLGLNPFLLGGFVLFWMVVFAGLYSLTHPSKSKSKVRAKQPVEPIVNAVEIVAESPPVHTPHVPAPHVATSLDAETLVAKRA